MPLAALAIFLVPNLHCSMQLVTGQHVTGGSIKSSICSCTLVHIRKLKVK